MSRRSDTGEGRRVALRPSTNDALTAVEESPGGDTSGQHVRVAFGRDQAGSAPGSSTPSAAAHRGFSMVELLIVVAVIGVIAAIAIPNLVASRRAGYEGTAKVKLAQAAGQERMYRSTLRKNTYATIAQLQTTMSGGAPLLSAGDTTATGWTFSEVAGAVTATTFGLKAVPTADNPADRSYVIFEDSELRRCPRTGPWDRSCARIEQ